MLTWRLSLPQEGFILKFSLRVRVKCRQMQVPTHGIWVGTCICLSACTIRVPLLLRLVLCPQDAFHVRLPACWSVYRARCFLCYSRSTSSMYSYRHTTDWNNGCVPEAPSKVQTECVYTDMRCLTTGIHSEKCVVKRFHRCAKVIVCTYTNLDSIAYYTPRLYGIAYYS
jgi:hypothetical protein